jgi:hypothetical protein
MRYKAGSLSFAERSVGLLHSFPASGGVPFLAVPGRSIDFRKQRRVCRPADPEDPALFVFSDASHFHYQKRKNATVPRSRQIHIQSKSK